MLEAPAYPENICKLVSPTARDILLTVYFVMMKTVALHSGINLICV